MLKKEIPGEEGRRHGMSNDIINDFLNQDTLENYAGLVGDVLDDTIENCADAQGDLERANRVLDRIQCLRALEKDLENLLKAVKDEQGNE